MIDTKHTSIVTLLRNCDYSCDDVTKKYTYDELVDEATLKLLPLTVEVPDHVYVLGYTYPCHTLNTTDTLKKHSSDTCGMYKASLRHIHDPVLLPLKVEVFVQAVVRS